MNTSMCHCADNGHQFSKCGCSQELFKLLPFVKVQFCILQFYSCAAGGSVLKLWPFAKGEGVAVSAFTPSCVPNLKLGKIYELKKGASDILFDPAPDKSAGTARHDWRAQHRSDAWCLVAAPCDTNHCQHHIRVVALQAKGATLVSVISVPGCKPDALCQLCSLRDSYLNQSVLSFCR